MAPDAPRRFVARIPMRVRITLWVLAIFAVVHVTLTLVVVMYHHRDVTNEVESDLVEAVENASRDRTSIEPDSMMIRVLQQARAARWGPVASMLFDLEGELLSTAGPYDGQTLARLRAETSGAAMASNEIVTGRAGSFLYAAAQLDAGHRLVVAAPIDEMRRAVDPVTLVLLLTLPVGLLSTGVASWYVAGLAIRPIEQVQHFAEELSAETVSADIQLDDSGPETESLRKELQSAMARLEAGYESQARFLANVSHELKTPISVLRTQAEVLLAGDVSLAELTSFARSTSEEMHRLGRMIESFLLLTRVKQGKMSVQLKRHLANELLMESVSHCLTMAEQYHVRIEPTLCDGSTPPFVAGNKELIQTAIDNLIRNAIRFSPTDGRVRVICRLDDRAVRFRVRDYGPGIPPDVIERIFEPFTQASEERRRGRGTGLGLQIAQGIAELHAGRVEVENLEEGCVFTLRLPLAE